VKALILLAVFLLGAGAVGCANPPRFVKRTPVLRLIYRPWGKPFLDHPQFSFYVKRDWDGPETIDSGVRFREPKRRAWVSVQFLMPTSPDYRRPNEFRQYMREQGTIGDAHVLSEVEVSSRTASVARFTTYNYSPEFLLGEKVDVLYTEMIMVPDPAGLYLLKYEAQKDRFFKYYRVQKELLRTMTLATPKEEENLNPLPWLKK
jgi:hypothetical protein